jgi:cobalt-zinc-cadmium efflux system protein
MTVGHSHHHLSAHGQGDSTYTHRASPAGASALGIAVLLTGGYALVEFFGGLLSGSLALLADAGHMALDAAALLFAFIANIIARRPLSDRHSFGLARAEVIAAFVNALTMIGIVIWLVVEAVHRIRNPVEVNGSTVFVVAGIGLVINLLTVWLLARGQQNLNTRAALVHVLGDLLGSVAAIVAGVIIFSGGPLIVDPLLSLLVGGLILRSTIGILRQSTLVLLDSVPEGIDYQRVGAGLASIPGVIAVHDLHIWSMVPGRSALSAHVLVEDIDRWPGILRDSRKLLLRDFQIEHVTLQPEWLRRDAPEVAIPIRSLS